MMGNSPAQYLTHSADETIAVGRQLMGPLRPPKIVIFTGDFCAGPTVTIYHIDLYRVDSPRQLETLGIDDLRDERSLILLEWGEKFERFRNEADAEIRIERLGENDRKIIFTGR